MGERGILSLFKDNSRRIKEFYRKIEKTDKEIEDLEELLRKSV